MSTIKANAWQNQAGTKDFYPCLAWVNFDGTGTVAIRASGNVSSITDNGTGDYTVNFTNNMADANYSASSTCKGTTSVRAYMSFGLTAYIYGKSSLELHCFSESSSASLDSPLVSVQIHGNT